MKKIFSIILYSLFFITGCTSSEDKSSTLEINTSECQYHLPFSSNLYKEVDITQYPHNPDPDGSHHEGKLVEAYDFSFREYLAHNTTVHDIEIVASRAGEVTQAVPIFKNDVDCGDDKKIYINKANYVIIDHGDGEFSVYMHLKAVYVTEGDKVQQGEVIGLYGNTGWTYCQDHLHYQVQNKGKGITQSVETCFAELENGKIIAAPSDDIPSIDYSINSVDQETISGRVVSNCPKPSVALDLEDPTSMASWIVYAVMSKDTDIFKDLIGPSGTYFPIPYAVGLEAPFGYDNGDEVAKKMKTVLSKTNPNCIGYSINEYGKVLILFDNLDLSDFTEYPPETNIVQFIAEKYFTGKYELIAIGGNPWKSEQEWLLDQVNEECICK